MFVPSGWYHQVHNLTRSLSINHNWFDSSALASVCAFVVAEAIEVRKRIADCQTAHLDIAEDVQFGVLCERVMRADIRCNIAQFCLLLSLLHGLLKPGPAADLRPLLHDPSTVGKAIDECAGLLAAEPLVQMSMAAAQDEQLRESMVKHGLCIVACFIGERYQRRAPLGRCGVMLCRLRSRTFRRLVEEFLSSVLRFKKCLKACARWQCKRGA